MSTFDSELMQDVKTVIQSSNIVVERLSKATLSGFEGMPIWEEVEITLSDEERLSYLRGHGSYVQFMQLSRDMPASAALSRLDDRMIVERVKEYNDWCDERDLSQKYCFAAFLGPDLENKICSQTIPH